MAQRLLPSTVQQIGHELAIAWNDGTEIFLPLEALRRACPCAVCRGEPDVLGNLESPEVEYAPESFELQAWQVIGGYALRPSWGDGHGTGLYTFGLLQRIAAKATVSEQAKTAS